MNTVVIGAGAVGLALGTTLHAAGERVSFVTRSQERATLLRHGVRRTGLFGEARIEPASVRAFDSVDGLIDLSPLDFVLVCVKTHASAELARSLGSVWERLTGSPRLVLFQNGWGSADLFTREIPAKSVFSARVITGFRRPAPHVSEITVHADSIRAGSLFGADPCQLEPLCSSITAGGIPCAVSADVAQALWAKMLYNCALNPLGALLRVPYGALAERETTRNVMAAVVREVFAVMEAAGYRTEWDSPEAYLEALFGKLLPPTATHESSMLQDLRAGRPTEVDALSGAVADLGTRHGIPTPVNAALCALVKGGRSQQLEMT